MAPFVVQPTSALALVRLRPSVHDKPFQWSKSSTIAMLAAAAAVACAIEGERERERRAPLGNNTTWMDGIMVPSLARSLARLAVRSDRCGKKLRAEAAHR